MHILEAFLFDTLPRAHCSLARASGTKGGLLRKNALLAMAPIAALLLMGCTETLKTVNQGLATALPPKGLARITTDQQSRIQMALAMPLKDEQLQLMVKDAAPVIQTFLERVSCINAYRTSALNAYAAPGRRLDNFNAPILLTKYHNKNVCMTLTRIQAVEMPARNAIRFEAVYTSDLSGEVAKTTHVAVRQPEGHWLFNS
ncbi:hypothetical protein [Eleftheria terrae]|uniref:hypothetical protein n=1 Tax=Eleftheria terrae TaxID=1597781 RepID=UPI00263B270B|nr:hypothetical protein [Eleftheria terrae]WKB50523.1 hypothetical protein N7L95_00305 [Eleftheria terrae]